MDISQLFAAILSPTADVATIILAIALVKQDRRILKLEWRMDNETISRTP